MHLAICAWVGSQGGTDDLLLDVDANGAVGSTATIQCASPRMVTAHLHGPMPTPWEFW
jgi:hypothetical protein